jgi:hypothetical protein
VALDGAELHRLTITSGLDPDDGTLTFDVEWSDDLGPVEALGLLEAAKAVVVGEMM